MHLVSFVAQTLRSEKTGHGQGGTARDLTQTSLPLPSPFPSLSLSFISFFLSLWWNNLIKAVRREGLAISREDMAAGRKAWWKDREAHWSHCILIQVQREEEEGWPHSLSSETCFLQKGSTFSAFHILSQQGCLLEHEVGGVGWWFSNHEPIGNILQSNHSKVVS